MNFIAFLPTLFTLLYMHLLCLMAMTLDGKIARDSAHFPDWTGKADKRHFVEVTKRCRVVIMGSKTYDTLGKPLPARKNVVLTQNLHRISTSEHLIFTNESPAVILRNLKCEGYDSAALIGGSQTNTLFAKAGLINEFWITVIPTIFGKGLSLFTEELDIPLVLQEVRPLEEGRLLLHYKCIHP